MENWLAARTKASPNALALIIGKQRWSYAELNHLVDICAGHLAEIVSPGQHVGILMPNNLAYVCLIHALARVGAVLVPLNMRLTVPELVWQIDRGDCRLLVTNTVTSSQASSLAARGISLISAEDLFNPATSSDLIVAHQFTLENPQAIVFTSGTSGQPKGAVLSYANHYWSAVSSAFRLGLHKEDRWLSCLPLYHVGGLAVILRSCLYGTAVILHDRFDEEAISSSLDRQAVTLISLVPTMLLRLLNYRRDRSFPASLRHVLLGGAAASEELYQRCRKLDIPLSVTYGLTEAASQVATMLPQQTLAKPGSVGKPLLFTSVEIIDDKGRALPAGSVGEICVTGPTVMGGYYKDERATSEILREGRLHTGDMGFVDKEGDLWLLQRRSDIIISGGENIYPSEVEEILLRHPAVAAACVVGIPDPLWGQRVAATIELHTGASLTKEELSDFARNNLAGYKLPREILFVKQLPQTASGKVHRQLIATRLREQDKNFDSSWDRDNTIQK